MAEKYPDSTAKESLPGKLLKNKKYKITAGVLLAVIIVFGGYYLFLRDTESPTVVTPTESDQQVENDTSPEIEESTRARVINDASTELDEGDYQDLFAAPVEYLTFAAPTDLEDFTPSAVPIKPMTLLEITTDSAGANMAIIETDTAVLEVLEGDHIDDDWFVQEIFDDRVLLRNENEDKSIFLSFDGYHNGQQFDRDETLPALPHTS